MLALRKQRLFFPFFGLLKTRRQQGDRWAELIDSLDSMSHTDAPVIAFRLTLDRIRRAAGRERSSCRDQFCATCTAEIVALFEGTEDQLLAFYHENLAEVEATLRQMKTRTRVFEEETRKIA